MSLFCRAVKKTQTLTSSGGQRKGNASHFFVFLCFNGVLYRVKPVSGWRGDNGGLGIVKTGEHRRPVSAVPQTCHSFFLHYYCALYNVKPVRYRQGNNGGLESIKNWENKWEKGEIGRIVGQSHSGNSHLSSQATHRYSMHFEAYICVYRSLLVMLVMNFEKLLSFLRADHTHYLCWGRTCLPSAPFVVVVSTISFAACCLNLLVLLCGACCACLLVTAALPLLVVAARRTRGAGGRGRGGRCSLNVSLH